MPTISKTEQNTFNRSIINNTQKRVNNWSEKLSLSANEKFRILEMMEPIRPNQPQTRKNFSNGKQHTLLVMGIIFAAMRLMYCVSYAYNKLVSFVVCFLSDCCLVCCDMQNCESTTISLQTTKCTYDCMSI